MINPAEFVPTSPKGARLFVRYAIIPRICRFRRSDEAAEVCMENRPGRPKSASPPRGAEGEGTEPGDSQDREQTPLPTESENWTALGATRIVPADGGAAELQPDDTALPGPDLPESVGKTVLGDFRLLKKIGEGAMGAVYKAHQISFNRDVALKVLFKRIASNDKLVKRLNREALAMGRLDHPNIVRGYGVDQAQG